MALVDLKTSLIHSLEAAETVDPNAPRQGADFTIYCGPFFEEAIFGVEKRNQIQQ